ncbi:MAG: peptidase [Muricauda sp.]|nr:zinc-dependent metalloprotease [Allomuricauda sp.]MAU26106.1 peptidase [Allomuricauda sp.]MBC29809.1 peptidase [Allomuricauda sp.]|tara:strand:- start:46924 stop:49329 length:2406 start_codon:yes stop_codon:yes gene_type:complete
MKNALLLSALLYLFVNTAWSQSFDKANGFQKFNGFLNFYYDDKNDKIYLQVDELEKEFLYVYSLSSGIGSNDIGLDRGQLGNEQVVYFKKAGQKLLLVQPNMRFRALTDNKLEKMSVEQAFAKSILGGFEIFDQSKGSYLIDISDFLMRDAHGVARRLKQTDQGNYSLDKKRSAWNFDRTKAFPKNIEFDVFLTFKGEPKGRNIRSVTPDPTAVTVAQHHSFIELPDDGFEMREFDPRCGSYPFTYYDYSTPVQEPILKRYIPRHRLQKKNPNAEMSEAVEPIIYYLDNGTPEPVRSALLEGGRWWNQAFEAIGYKDAFQVKMLPDNADPMDVRYNVIQWVHRSTRGWSYGSSVQDPRTGEIIKGHVSLGSLRIRQDFMIAQALMNKPFAERDDNYRPMLELALARIRQLSAHEIGHTLGFAHNFAASTNDRASVMDYPHPQFTLKNGEIDFSNVYDTGIGEWDKVTVAYAYSDFPKGVAEEQALNNILAKAQSDGLRYISDQDARPIGGAHGLAHLWDNGKNASRELDAILKIRETAIDNFSVDNIRSGEPLSVLEDVFVPLYFLHRYQTEATVKLVGGLDYNYAVKGDGQLTVKTLERTTQEEALQTLLKTLEPKTLAIPESKLSLFPPRSIGYPRTRESFKGKTGVAFDPLGVAETAAHQTLMLLLHPQRANRLVQQKALDKQQLGLKEVVSTLLDATIMSKVDEGYLGEVQKLVNWQTLQELMHLASAKESHPQVTETILNAMTDLKKELESRKEQPHAALLLKEVEKFIGNPKGYERKIEAPKIPDGSPIGMDCFH